MFAVLSFKALLALLNADPRVQNELCSLVDIDRELVHVPYRPAQAVHGAQAHCRDAISAVANMAHAERENTER